MGAVSAFHMDVLLLTSYSSSLYALEITIAMHFRHFPSSALGGT
jgi:hypothetical protein